MTYQTGITYGQMAKIRELRKGLLEKTLLVPKQGIIVEHTGRPGNYYFVLPTVFQPNEGCIPLLNNYRIENGEKILDFGTGSGVIAIDAALKGASKVNGVDINKNALRSARINSIINNVEEIVSFGDNANRLRDKYDVITANLPFTDEPSSNTTEKAAYDSNLSAHEDLFYVAQRLLKYDGRIYLAQANFGAVDGVLSMANNFGFTEQKLIGKKRAWGDTGTIFYAFELRRAQ